jgi:hypothetical protein
MCLVAGNPKQTAVGRNQKIQNEPNSLS